MVRLTYCLCRVPVIKFKKGGLGHPAAQPTAAASPASCPAPGRSHVGRPSSDEKPAPKMLGMIRIPKGALISGTRGPELVTLNIVLQKQEAGNRKSC